MQGNGYTTNSLSFPILPCLSLTQLILTHKSKRTEQWQIILPVSGAMGEASLNLEIDVFFNVMPCYLVDIWATFLEVLTSIGRCGEDISCPGKYENQATRNVKDVAA
jgi:hypothetical protein